MSRSLLRRLLACLLLLGMFILPYGVAATDAWEDFANLPGYSFGLEDKELELVLRKSGLRASSVPSFSDTGEGWYCFSECLTYDDQILFNGIRYDSLSGALKNSSAYSGAAAGCVIQFSDGQYMGCLLALDSSNASEATMIGGWASGGEQGFRRSYNGNVWFVSTSLAFTSISDVSIPIVEYNRDANNTRGHPLIDDALLDFIISSTGATTDSSVIVPPADHIMIAYNNAPYKLTYWTGAEQAELLSGPYELSNGTSELFSVSDLSTFGRQAHNLSPAYDGVLARYTCVKDYDYNVSDYQSITVSGTYKLSLSYTSVSSDNTSFMRIINPDNMYLLVNGDRIGASDIVYDRDSGILTVNHTISLANYGGISSLGVYADYSFAGDIGTGAQSLSVDVRLADDFTVSSTVSPAEPPEPVDNIETMTGGILSLLRDLLNFLFGLVSNIMNGIVSLFVPSADDLTGLKDRYTTLLSEKLGFIYDGFAWLGEFIGSFNSEMANSEDYTFHFPGVSYVHPGEQATEYVILAEQDVDLDNDLMSVLRPVAGTVVSIAAVLSLINLCFNMFVAVISGKSYMEFWSYQDNVDFYEDREFWKWWYG